jgi:hypothetical protein
MNKEFGVCSALGMLLLATACQSEVKSTAEGVKPAAVPGEVRATDAKNGYDETALGTVIAVKRTFKLDLADCEKNFKVAPHEENSTVLNGTCDVKFAAEDPAEDHAGTIGAEMGANRQYDDGVWVNIYAKETGYEVTASVQAQPGEELAFARVQAAIDQAMKAYAPKGEVSVIVHTVAK